MKRLLSPKPADQSVEWMQRGTQCLWYVVLPMCVGVLIYWCFRDMETLVVIDWLQFLETTPRRHAPDFISGTGDWGDVVAY